MKYIPVAILFIILILPALTILNLRKEIGFQRTKADKVLYFHGPEDFQFSFTSPKKNLYSIILRLENINSKISVGRNSKPLYFTLLEDETALRDLQISGSNFVNDAYVRFTFPVIENSENKNYTIILSSPESEGGEALGIFSDTLRNPVIITYHIPISKLEIIISIYRDFADRILADKIFFATWIILLGSIVLIVKSVKL